MSAPYFLVHRVETKGGVAFVDGRTGDSKILKGHVFSRVFDQVESWRTKGEFRSGRFVLSRIEAYKHVLDELDPGVTARLRIEGADLDALSVAQVLE